MPQKTSKNPVTLVGLFEKRMELLCKQQDFEGASNVRQLKRALPEKPIVVKKSQLRAVNSFLKLFHR